MYKCYDCDHVEMCAWREELNRDGCEFYSDGNRWIPVSERLPEEKGEYLVTYHPCYWDMIKTVVKVGLDTFRGKTTWAKKKYQRVVAWKPLPEPYKEQEHE